MEWIYFTWKELAVAIHLEDHPVTSLEELSVVLSPSRSKTGKNLPQTFDGATTPFTKIRGYASYIFNCYNNERNSEQ